VGAKSSVLPQLPIKYQHIARHPYLPAVGLAAVAALAVLGSLAAYHAVYANRIFPGISIGPVLLGGLTLPEAEQRLQGAWDEFAEQGINVVVGTQQVILTPRVFSSTDPDLTYDLVHFDPAVAARAAYAVGRQGGYFGRLLSPMAVRLWPQRFPPQVVVEQERVLTFLRDSLPNLEQEPQPAHFQFDEPGNAVVVPGQDGLLIDTDNLRHELGARFASLTTGAVTLNRLRTSPVVSERDLIPLLPEVRSLARTRPLTFTFETSTWVAEPLVWHRWLAARPVDGKLQLGFSTSAAAAFFSGMAEALNQPARDAKFELQQGRVKTFVPSQAGRALDVAASLAAAEAVVRSDAVDTVPLSVAIAEPSVSTADANDFGIAELIGTGTSNFKGSPKNRRHNIRAGAASLNGVLVKPDEEFSLVTALGEISGETGYLQELVIKGNQTIPEFGGGLCQIGTTTFRAVLASGLPILERRNHSYRVVYYEPAGTDATIYDPKPDFRFKNDTGSNILIQTRINGDELIFEFWGKRDGRTAEQTKPRIFNITAPPPTKLVETEDLKPGEKKCTERPHSGADTEFTYTVTYPDSRQEVQVFKSHYVPWQEVCLIGVPKGTLSQPAGAGTALPSADTTGQQGN